MPRRGYYYGPWYRGGIPRSYVAPSVFASVGCAICLGGFAVFFMIAGGAMLGISSIASKQSNAPPFDDPFFKEHRKNSPDIPGIVGTIGAVFLGIGCTMLVVSVIMCVVVAFLAKKQENKRHAAQQNPLNHNIPQPPPPSAYPHQPLRQDAYPPPGSYPAQPVDSAVPLQSQNQYPPQPASYYPPPLSVAPPPDNQYPPPSYAPSEIADTSKQPLQ